MHCIHYDNIKEMISNYLLLFKVRRIDSCSCEGRALEVFTSFLNVEFTKVTPACKLPFTDDSVAVVDRKPESLCGFGMPVVSVVFH